MNEPLDIAQPGQAISHRLLGTGIILAVLVAGYGHFLHHHFFHDDAYITLRYSYNWLHGHGVNWNPGERVEGYTSFLHLAMVTMLGWLHLDLVLATRLIGIASYGAICWLAFRHFRSDPGTATTVAPLLLCFLLASSFPLIAWSYAGLETTLVTFLVMAACYGIVSPRDHTPRRMAWLGMLFSLACLARPDGGLLVVITLVYLLIPRGNQARSRIAVAWFLGGFIMIYLPYFCWRYTYYGELLPNTFYAKMTGMNWFRLRTGGHYVHTFARIAPFWLPMTLVACGFLYRSGQWCWQTAYMLTLVLGHTGYIIYTGGDHMPAYRFMIPALPLMGWLIVQAIKACTQSGSVSSWIVIILALLLALSQAWTRNERMLNARRLDPAAAVGADVGHWLDTHLPSGSLVALNTAGSSPYHARNLIFIDMLGLNDRHIAHRRDIPMRTAWQRYPGHAKGDGQYVLTRQPDVVILGPAQGVVADANHLNDEGIVWFLSDQELAESDAFAQHYHQRQVTFRGRSGAERTLIYYERYPVVTSPGR